LEDGTWVVNLHAAQARHDPEQRDLARALVAADGWAGGAPLVFGGDLNQPAPRLPGLAPAASNGTDHVFVRGFAAAGPAERLEHDGLSDHAPLAVELLREGAAPG
jgi:endonuclease/exonuclease/phosphatase (EEP) superfamily protein YafD